MLNPRLFLFLFLFLLSALVLPACTVHSGRGSDEGTLILRWTIDGTDDPSDCVRYDVDTISVSVETSDGHFVDEFQAPCEDFETAIDLPEDDYHADVVLVDTRDRDATTTTPTRDFPIFPDEDTPIDVEFPDDSFL